jgi:ATP-binding cassette, subfamily B, bacterial CvaB/MchF/RaxB
MKLPERMQQAAAIVRRTTPLVLQTETAECGLACLAMIAARYGHRVDLPALRQRYSVSLRGSTLRDLVRIAADMRLATRALRAEATHLRRLRLPSILHWDHNHFVVLVRVGTRRAIVLDPAVGRRRVALQEVDKRFTGIVIEAWPTEDFERKTERARVRIWELLRRTHGFAAAATQVVAMSLVLETVGIAIPIGFQLVLDDVVVSTDRDLLTLIALGVGLVLALRALIDFVRSWAILAASSTLTLYWKMSLFKHLLRLPLSFFERRHAGDVASRFLSIDKIQQTLGTSSISPVVDGAMGFVLLGMMWLYSPWLAVLAVGTTTIYALIRALAYRLYRRANEEAIVYAACENSHFLEIAARHGKHQGAGDRRPSAGGLEQLPRRLGRRRTARRQDRYDFHDCQHLSIRARPRRGHLLWRPCSAGRHPLGRHARRFPRLQGSVLPARRQMPRHSCEIGHADGTWRAHCRYRARRTRAGGGGRFGGRCRDGRGAKAGLGARAISFRYSDAEPRIIADFDLDIAPGECVALAGPSGAGKTTLLKIFAGLLRPTAGTVLIDDVPIEAVGLEAYRAQIGCVLQEDRLFAGSIAENIAGFSPSPDRERIQQVAKLAAIHEEIMRMPMGYETLVGDMGSSLSGGQMQRTVLARALYRGPRILLLDEATSHLDEDNERAINEAIRRLPISRLIVAHRRSTLDMADRVVPIWPATKRAG